MLRRSQRQILIGCLGPRSARCRSASSAVKHADEILGLGRGELEFVNHDHVAGFQAFGEGLAQTPVAWSFWITFLLKSRGFGPKTTPPPRHNGERMNQRERDRCPFGATAFCWCRRLRPWSWCKRCPCVGRPDRPRRCHGQPGCRCRLQRAGNFTSSSPWLFPLISLICKLHVRSVTSSWLQPCWLRSRHRCLPFGCFLDSRMTT